jgi:hypothetical protein
MYCEASALSATMHEHAGTLHVVRRCRLTPFASCVESAWLLLAKCNTIELFLAVAFNFNLRRYNVDPAHQQLGGALLVPGMTHCQLVIRIVVVRYRFHLIHCLMHHSTSSCDGVTGNKAGIYTVEILKLVSKAPTVSACQRLRLEYEILLSSLAFSCSMRLY